MACNRILSVSPWSFSGVEKDIQRSLCPGLYHWELLSCTCWVIAGSHFFKINRKEQTSLPLDDARSRDKVSFVTSLKIDDTSPRKFFFLCPMQRSIFFIEPNIMSFKKKSFIQIQITCSAHK